MAPKASAGVSVEGSIAYQDDADPCTFHYLPSGSRLAATDHLEAFSVKYWGIGERYYADHDGGGHISSLVGATVSGQAIFDITPAERDRLRREIARVYGQPSPRLLPLQLLNTQVVPTFGGHPLGVGADGHTTFPGIAQVGTRVVFNVASGRGKFAQLFAGVMTAGAGRSLSGPDFGLSVNGDVLFASPSWKVAITADLRRVWEVVRGRFPATAQVAWFTLGTAEFASVMRELLKSETVTVSYLEGRRDTLDPGEQLFAQGRFLFDALNAQIWAGDGLFKLEPDPSPDGPPPGGGSVQPWRFAVSGAYPAQYFSQPLRFERELACEGTALRRVPCSVVLAVPCSHETDRCFYDLCNPDTPAVTPAKMDRLHARLGAEKEKQALVVRAASRNLAENAIGRPDYDRVMGYLQNNSLNEDVESGDAMVASLSGQHRRAQVQRWSRLADVGYTGILRRLA
jgi:hypothetical protein